MPAGEGAYVVPRSMPMVVSGRASTVAQSIKMEKVAAVEITAQGSVETLDFDFIMYRGDVLHRQWQSRFYTDVDPLSQRGKQPCQPERGPHTGRPLTCSSQHATDTEHAMSCMSCLLMTLKPRWM
jgi:hypothetical protein